MISGDGDGSLKERVSVCGIFVCAYLHHMSCFLFNGFYLQACVLCWTCETNIFYRLKVGTDDASSFLLFPCGITVAAAGRSKIII